MKAIFAAFLLVIFCTVLNADPYQTFSSIVDFKATLKSLSENRTKINSNKLYLIEGTITAIVRKNVDNEKFLIELELINSEWEDNSSLKTYRATIFLDKLEFINLFPNDPGQSPKQNQIGTNSRILALVQFLRVNNENTATFSLYFQALDIRIVK